MRNTVRVVVLLLLISWFFPFVAAAEFNWPKVKAALAKWDGVHQVTLRTELSDPFGRHEVQDLLEAFIDLGYVVTPATLGASVDQGLALDMRDSRNGMVLILSRGSDGAVIAIDRLPETATAAPATTAEEESAVQEKEVTSQPVVAPIAETSPAPETNQPRRYASRAGSAANLRSGSIELEGQPRQVLVLGQKADGSLELALQRDAAISIYRLAGSDLQKTREFKPPLSNSRALFADAGDLDGSEPLEIAAVWGEDHRSIYEGTDTQLHSWILDAAAFQPLSSDLEGYLRIVKKRGYLQFREQFEPFSENIYPLAMQDEQYGSAAVPTAWGHRNLYAASPLNETRMIAWDDENRLQIISRQTGKTVSGSTVMKDLGAFKGPEVAIRLPEPEYRSGFGKEDKIYERYHSLGRRVAFDTKDRLYTIARERSTGLIPLFEKSAGKDTLVRLTRDGQGLVMDYVFGGIDAYILDFALLEDADQPIKALLLLNDKEDGSGQAYLLEVQSEL